MKKNIQYAVVSAMAFALAACGGGGSDGSNNPPPVQNPPPTQNTDPGTIDNTMHTSTYSGEQKAHFEWLNAARAQCGLGTLKQNAALDTAALNHFNYLKDNFAAGLDEEVFVTGIHNENPALPGFTGVDFRARASYANYTGTAGSEVIGGVYNLSGATYHALALMMAGMKDIGFKFGEVPRPLIGPTIVETWGVHKLGYNGSTQEPPSDKVLTYPCEGSVLQNTVHGYESPDPFVGTTKDALQASPALMAKVKVGQRLVIASWTVTKSGTSTPVPNFKILTTRTDSLVAPHMAALILDEPLVSGATYTATITGTNNGQAFTSTYTFTVK